LVNLLLSNTVSYLSVSDIMGHFAVGCCCLCAVFSVGFQFSGDIRRRPITMEGSLSVKSAWTWTRLGQGLSNKYWVLEKL